MLVREFHRVNHRVGANVRLFNSSRQYSDYFGYVADISISGMRLVLNHGGPNGVSPGVRARWFIRRLDEADLDGHAVVIRSSVREDGAGEIVLQFDRVRHDVVRAIPSHDLIEVELNLLVPAHVAV